MTPDIVLQYYKSLKKDMDKKMTSKNKSMKASMELWTVRQIILRTKNCTDQTKVVEDFRKELDRFACIRNKGSYSFSIAYDTASYVLDMLLDDWYLF